ncbi:MAG: hypothetical protein P4L56_01385 [Candidatus Sulfopaludibacter sp.]|nr:hypothetical protein [Candidatus Sulfopaludibacter sp.]
MIKTELSLVTVLLCGFGLWIIGMFAVALIRSLSWQKQNQRTRALQPQIRQALVAFLAGSDNQDRLREFVQISRADVGAALVSFEGTVAGGARDRLCELALELTLVHDWCEETRSRNALVRRTAFARLSFVCSYEPCRRLAGDLMLRAIEDPDDEVTLSASRGLVHSSSIEVAERVFGHAVSKNLLVRIVLTEDLRRHAVSLCQRAIPRELKSGDRVRILNTLHMATAWERALPMPGMGALLSSDDREVRMQALQLASLVADAPEVRTGILDALADSDPEIVICAAGAAALQHLEAALPALARCLRVGELEVARAAAAALAEIPPRGWVTLRELSTSTNDVTARAASDALARMKVPE